MPRITEKRDVQDQLINFLSDIGWTFIGRTDLPGWRDNDEKEPFLIAVLRRQLAALFKSMLHQLMTGQIRLLKDEGLSVV